MDAEQSPAPKTHIRYAFRAVVEWQGETLTVEREVTADFLADAANIGPYLLQTLNRDIDAAIQARGNQRYEHGPTRR